MGNEHREMPGSGVAFWETVKKSDKGPDYKGFVTLEMDYKAGEKLKMAFWLKNTSNGNTLLANKEDNYSKRMNMEKDTPREYEPKPRVQPTRQQPPRRAVDLDDDSVPF